MLRKIIFTVSLSETLQWILTVMMGGGVCALAFALGVRDPISETFLIVGFTLGAVVATFHAKTAGRLSPIDRGWLRRPHPLGTGNCSACFPKCSRSGCGQFSLDISSELSG